MNVGIVVLHYKTYNDTVRCVNSYIDNINHFNYKIVIVDNFSNDGSFEKLSNYFKKNNNVEVISTGCNIGFANGNNFGYSYLKKSGLDFEFVIFCNNDTYIDDSNFIEKLLKSHKQLKWDVMGPDIVRVNDGIHQNPLPTPKWNVFSINRRILNFSIKIFILKILPFILGLKRSGRRDSAYNSGEIRVKENVCLHGAVLIFSKSYLKKFEDVFYDKTFLYLEEDILYLRCEANGLKTVYDSTLKVFHNHSSSTKMVYKDEAKRKVFFLKNQIASLKVLKEYLSNLD